MTVANLFTSPHLTSVVVDSGGLTVTTGGLSVAAGATTLQAMTAAAGTFSGLVTAQSGLTSAAGATPVIANWQGGAGLLGVIAVQRSGANKFFVGLDASDNFALLNAAGGASNLTITDTGAVTIRSTLAVTSDFAVNTNKFTVAASTGNTVVAGTLAVTGSITGTLGTAAQANITSVGTLSSLAVTGDITVNTNKLVVTGSSGALASAASVQGITGLLTGVGSTGTGGLFDKNQVAMTGSAVAISSVAQGSAAALAVVRGTDGTNAFTDIVHYGGNVANPPLSQLTLTGSPTARTYTSASGVLRLSMSSAYTVACCDHRGITLN